MLDEELLHVRAAMYRRRQQRSIVMSLHIRAMLNEKLHNVRMAIGRRRNQRSIV